MRQPHPIIPQTPDQARQRDRIHGRDIPKPENPVHELARLRNAIRTHRQQLQDTGPLNLCPECRADNDDLTAAKHAADHALWAHLPDA